MENDRAKYIAKKSENISEWYTDVILKSELADYGPVKGCMVMRPYGYALWEAVQHFMDPLIKKHGVQNAYFPLFIPESFLHREKEHVKGFAPEFAVVTHAGGEDLKEKLVVRPTSETIMYEMYKQWVHSWRDLPVLINQWNNVVRWEKRTYLFLRTSEFLWQEGHCAHATDKENMQTVLWALKMYAKTYQDLMAVYGIMGVKSESEKFAGAAKTFTYEIMMPDGKALQGCTSHNLGQNFSKAFDWTVLDQNGQNLNPWQNSWGFSTRSIAAVIMAHGDDSGLKLPPMIAPVQVVIVPIYKTETKEAVIAYAKAVQKKLKSLRVVLDDREGETAGFKFNKWELKGAPLRIEIGAKEAETQSMTYVRRDSGQKANVKLGDAVRTLKNVLKNMQESMLEQHRRFTEDHTRDAHSYDEFKMIMQTTRGFIKAFWCESAVCEEKIKQETKASTRCLPLDQKPEKGICVYCGKSAKHRWLFAQAY